MEHITNLKVLFHTSIHLHIYWAVNITLWSICVCTEKLNIHESGLLLIDFLTFSKQMIHLLWACA